MEYTIVHNSIAGQNGDYMSPRACPRLKEMSLRALGEEPPQTELTPISKSPLDNN